MVCSTPLSPGVVGYTDMQGDEPAEVWSRGAETHRDGLPCLTDPDGHPLTWGYVHAAHTALVAHATCGEGGGDGYGSDEDNPLGHPCECQWGGGLTEQLDCFRQALLTFPGPVCRTCWAASCKCGYVFDAPGDAAGADHTGIRLRCYACAE